MANDSSDFEALHEQNCQRTYELRRATWSAWGELDSDVLAPMINPAFMGAPRWPNLRRAYCASRQDGKVLLATDGLSDPFDSPDEPRHNG